MTGVQTCALPISEIAAADPILFPPGEATIAEGSGAVLDRLAETLRRCDANAEIEVGGHTDSQGSEDYNLRLSRARAEAVREALLRRGAPARLLSARGYGETAPIADNSGEAGRALNRRIAFAALDAKAESGAGAQARP